QEGRPLQSCFPHRALPHAAAVSEFAKAAAEAQALSDAEAKPVVVILGLEHLDLGTRVNFVADTAEGKAALGALFSLCARRHRNGAPVVRLTSMKYSASSGAIGREPQFVVVDWECCSHSFDDDIPF